MSPSASTPAVPSIRSTYRLQTITLHIPDGTFPVPKLVRTGTDDYRSGSADVSTQREFWWTFGGFTPTGKTAVQGRYQRLTEVPHAPGLEYANSTRRWADSRGKAGFKMGGIFRDEDIVRTIVPDHGDMRLIAAKQTVAAADFVKVRTSEWNTERMVHIFSSSAGTQFLYGFGNEPGGRAPAGRIAPTHSAALLAAFPAQPPTINSPLPRS